MKTCLLVSAVVSLFAVSAMANCEKVARNEAQYLTNRCANSVSEVKLVRTLNGQEVYRIELTSSEDAGEAATIADSYVLVLDAISCAKISERELGGACSR